MILPSLCEQVEVVKQSGDVVTFHTAKLRLRDIGMGQRRYIYDMCHKMLTQRALFVLT
jgi:hypothetical protein